MFEKYYGLRKVVDGREVSIGTALVAIEEGLLPKVAGMLRDLFPSGKVLLVCDETTWEVAGEVVSQGFVSLGWDLDRLLALVGKEGHPVADDENIAHVREALAEGGYVAALAVGSGTVNDITKMASFMVGIPYAVVGTAPSMNGYTSVIAAILSDGVKTTVSAQQPLAVFCDVEVMAEAPYRMIASGFGDLLSRPVSNADWRLAHKLKGDHYSAYPLELIGAARDAVDGIAGSLPARDHAAISRLCEALCLSGFAMAVAGTSAPASGGEHLVSHYLDMIAIAQDIPHDFHGCQVGVGTLASAALYERLMTLEPETIDVERLVMRVPPWEAYSRTLKKRFDPYRLTDAVLTHCEPAYPSRQELRTRLHQVKEDWSSLMAFVKGPLVAADKIRADLVAAKAPATFEEISVSPETARRALLHSKDIRGRYTILDLLWELGLLEEWVDSLLLPQARLVKRG